MNLRTLARFLESKGCVLLRHRKHQVWALPTGGSLIVSGTTSDRYGLRNAYLEACRKLGLADPRPKRRRGRRPVSAKAVGPLRLTTVTKPLPSLAEQLRELDAR